MTDFKDGTEPLTDDGAPPCQTTEESAQTAPLAETADNTTTEVAQPDGDAVVHFPAPAHTVKDNGWAIAAFVLAFLVAPVGFVLGIVGAVYSRKVDGAGKGLAVAAIVIGALITLAFVLFCVFLVVLFRDMTVAIIEGIQQNIDENSAAAIVSLLR